MMTSLNWQCPGCGHVTPHSVIQAATIDYNCPGCLKVKISSYIPCIEEKEVPKEEFSDFDRAVMKELNIPESDYLKEVGETLKTIGSGILWSRPYHIMAKGLADAVKAEFEGTFPDG